MAARQGNRAAAPPQPSTARQNEYFVPRDGIDREVITSDICRYLGNDALVRPGTYESPDGRVTQGYFITAYRNLTSAMIQDLKSDSARWEQERRAATSRTGGGAGGTMHSSQQNGMFVRSSNTPLGSREQARGQPDYSTWKNHQQRDADTFEAYNQANAMDVDYSAAPAAKNSIYNTGAYSGAQIPGYPATAAYPQGLGATAQYPTTAYGYAAPAAQYSPGPQTASDRYPGIPGPPTMAGVPYGQDPTYVHGSNYQTSPGYVPTGPARMAPLVSSATASRSLYSATGAPVYGGDTDMYGGYPSATGSSATQAFPNDPLFGRGTTQPRQGYGAVPETQFDEHQTSTIQGVPTPTSSTTVQLASAGPSTTRSRDSEPRDQRERDQHREHRPRRSEADRDERHGTDRTKYRHGHRS
ncbi:hypothetical protein B0T17DRAFT_511513 [Bombardia bombarda]|uniref:Transcription factor RfeG n=1 Tax=Bombardia bombarda TaxID=252184 RepID=A0AA39WAN5_9PEZI|nr:hypothetical protein B0T17DRAFT_511513 [Bombardia bombarda]